MKRTILLAHNNLAVREAFIDVLGAHPDYKVIVHCNNGQDAEDALFRYKPDIAILDMDLDRLNGLSILERVHRLELKTNIALIAKNANQVVMRRAMAYGVLGYSFMTRSEQVLECVEALSRNEYYIDTALCHQHYYEVCV